MHPDWAREIREECLCCFCREGHVEPDCSLCADFPAFFFKQWGEWAPEDDFSAETLDKRGYHHLEVGGVTLARLGRKRAGRLLDGREWNELPRGAS